LLFFYHRYKYGNPIVSGASWQTGNASISKPARWNFCCKEISRMQSRDIFFCGVRILSRFMGSECRKTVFPCKEFQSSDISNMIVCYQDTIIACMEISIFFRIYGMGMLKSGIYQKFMKLISQIVQLPLPPLLRLQKSEFHEYFIQFSQRYI